MERVILHSDLNNFYASVECLYHPELRNKPVAVGGDAQLRHGIVLAKNEKAKRCGVQTGEALWQAKQKCPELVFVPPNFQRYLKYSKMAKEIYQEYTDQVESFGLDECWLDLTASTRLFGSGVKVADQVRQRIKFELGVTASVGVSFNKIFAKLGSDLKKPDATTEITRENFKQRVWPLPVEALLYVGGATKTKLNRYGIQTIGQLANAQRNFLEYRLGKNGFMLWAFANGHDASPVADGDTSSKIKSIGNSTTAPRDLISDQDIKITLYILCESVAERLRDHGLECATVQISIRDKELFSYQRQGKLDAPSCTAKDIFQLAYALFEKNHTNGKPIRSIGVRACQLTAQGHVQLSFLPEKIQAQNRQNLESSVDEIRRRYGHFSIQRGLMLTDKQLSNLDPKGDHIIFPESFLK